MKSIRTFVFGLLFSALNAQSAEPLKALLITGGCCHDYTKQKLIISQGISKRANVDWDIIRFLFTSRRTGSKNTMWLCTTSALGP